MINTLTCCSCVSVGSDVSACIVCTWSRAAARRLCDDFFFFFYRGRSSSLCSFLYKFSTSSSSSSSWSTIPVCPSLMCFANRGNTEGTNPSKILCLMFVCVCFVLCEFVSGPISWIFENSWFDGFYAE